MAVENSYANAARVGLALAIFLPLLLFVWPLAAFAIGVFSSYVLTVTVPNITRTLGMDVPWSKWLERQATKRFPLPITWYLWIPDDRENPTKSENEKHGP